MPTDGKNTWEDRTCSKKNHSVFYCSDNCKEICYKHECNNPWEITHQSDTKCYPFEFTFHININIYCYDEEDEEEE